MASHEYDISEPYKKQKMTHMTESQKRTLRIHNPDLVHDLDLTADLTARFIHHGLFNEEMIEEIKSEKTRRERVQKVLFQLPRRGPRAFDMFVYSIQDTYPWLAEELRKTHHKISLKTEPEMISLKEKVDIFVHEEFGNSRRLCEEDKKCIKKFLYKQLKSQTVGYEPTMSNRRDSLQSDISEDIQELQVTNSNQESEEDIQNRILQRLFTILNSDKSIKECDNSENLNSINGPPKITLEIIEQKAKQMNEQLKSYEKKEMKLNKQVENLQNEIKNCFSVLGLENCDYSLQEVLETYKEKRQSEVAELSKIRERLDTLERQRHKLDEKLKAKERELQQSLNNLANEKLEKDRVIALKKDLEAKCDKLEKIQSKHLEKQQTLMTLKSMVQELSPNPRPNKETFRYPCAQDEVDGSAFQLPKLTQTRASKANRHSRKSGYHEPYNSNHHELPHAGNHNSCYPWKY